MIARDPATPPKRPAGGAIGRWLAGLAIVFLWFLIGGIGHFVATEAAMRIVPPYVP